MAREYGPTSLAADGATVAAAGATTDAALDVDVTFGPVREPGGEGSGEGAGGGTVLRGGHKTVRWQVALGNPAEAPLLMAIELDGAPTSFARSLVQGYFVEPLISIAAARRGLVLVPSAAIVGVDGLILILGRSGSGKSTLAARAMVAGRDVVGDDQVFVDRDGACRPFPRRLRFYPDIALTAPAAFARLSSGTKRALRIRNLVSAVSRGFVRPSLAVDRAELGGSWHAEPTPIRRIVLVERAGTSSGLLIEPGDGRMAVGWAADLLAEQRDRLARAGGPWIATLNETGERERAILATAFAGLPIERVAVPPAWAAHAAIVALARHLALE